MATDGWGPLSKLDAALLAHADSRGLNEAPIFAEALDPWQSALRHWPAPFWPPAMAAPAPSPWRRRWPWRRSASDAPDGATLARLAGEAQAWLATRNLSCIARWLTIAPDLAPEWLCGVSAWGLRAALVCYRASQHGALAAVQRGHDLQPTPADLLALHGCIEHVAALWAPARTGPAAGRRLGGLRTATFQAAWLDAPKVARTHLAALAAGSPLTRLVYLDLVTGPLPEDLQEALARFAGPQTAGDWLSDLWLTLLVHSAVGGLLSDLPPVRTWRLAVAERLQLEAALRTCRWDSWLRVTLQLGKAARSEVSAQAAAATALRGRLAAWHGVAVVLGRDFQARILDQLARFAAARAASAMREDWLRQRREDPRAFAGIALFGRDSAYQQALAGIMLGCDQASLLSLTTGNHEAERRYLDGLLDLPEPEEPAGPSARFWDDRAGIRLPFPPPDDRGPRPASVFTDLLVRLDADLSHPTGTAAPGLLGNHTDADTTEYAA